MLPHNALTAHSRNRKHVSTDPTQTTCRRAGSNSTVNARPVVLLGAVCDDAQQPPAELLIHLLRDVRESAP